MRPVHRGRAPRRSYNKFQEAIGDLEKRLGSYCSYCERRLPICLAVEHVVPKSRSRQLSKSWSNFLLGCPNCNSVKKDKATNGRDFLWPDKDNTLRAFSYSQGGLVGVANGLSRTVESKADKMRRLVGLHRHPGLPQNRDKPTARDNRWSQREEVWQLAVRQKKTLIANNSAAVRTLIIDAAKGYGFFSVWMSVFKNDRDMRKRIFAAFIGTAPNCFDARWRPIARLGGRI
jgi:uncharacterized protein (TIGR02646 family)